jgi:hypothetical protein
MRSGWSMPGESPAYDSPTDFDSWDRCITRGMPSSMMPYRYNGGFKIRQAPGVVVFDLEMIHDTRVVFTDGRPPLQSAHKHYMGDSRGRWQGNTLVVETTNYKGGLAPMITCRRGRRRAKLYAKILAGLKSESANLSAPKPPARDGGALCERAESGPDDIRIHTATMS